jgi:hypothetical protein
VVDTLDSTSRQFRSQHRKCSERSMLEHNPRDIFRVSRRMMDPATRKTESTGKGLARDLIRVGHFLLVLENMVCEIVWSLYLPDGATSAQTNVERQEGAGVYNDVRGGTVITGIIGGHAVKVQARFLCEIANRS